MPPPVKTTKLSADGSLSVVYDYGNNADGTPARTSWDVQPSNLEQHMPMFSADLSPGDRSAAQDVIAERKKRERERRG